MTPVERLSKQPVTPTLTHCGPGIPYEPYEHARCGLVGQSCSLSRAAGLDDGWKTPASHRRPTAWHYPLTERGESITVPCGSMQSQQETFAGKRSRGKRSRGYHGGPTLAPVGKKADRAHIAVGVSPKRHLLGGRRRQLSRRWDLSICTRARPSPHATPRTSAPRRKVQPPRRGGHN